MEASTLVERAWVRNILEVDVFPLLTLLDTQNLSREIYRAKYVTSNPNPERKVLDSIIT